MSTYTRVMLIVGLAFDEPADNEGRSLLERHRAGLLGAPADPTATAESLADRLGRSRDEAFGAIRRGLGWEDGDEQWFAGCSALWFEHAWLRLDHDGPLRVEELEETVRVVEERLKALGATRPPRVRIEAFTH